MTGTAFWHQPAAALVAELGTADTGLASREAALRLLRYGSNDAAAPKRPAGLASIHPAPRQSAGHHPAGGERALGRYWRCRKLRDHRQHRVALGAARLRAGEPGAECGGRAASTGGAAGGRAPRRRGSQPAGRPTGPWRHRPACRRRSGAGRRSAAVEPRFLRQPGAADRRILPGREAGSRARGPGGRNQRSGQRGARRHFGDLWQRRPCSSAKPGAAQRSASSPTR